MRTVMVFNKKTGLMKMVPAQRWPRYNPALHASFVALGGGDEIGKSSYWYRFPWPGSKYGYLSVIIDYGMHPHNGGGPNIQGVDHVDFVIASHAHADHSVRIPELATSFLKQLCAQLKKLLKCALFNGKTHCLLFRGRKEQLVKNRRTLRKTFNG
mgnify:CR=1 FL=1